MDELNSGFGSLSMNAAEWKPSNNTNSDLINPAAVKEFVPGRGWSASASNEQQPEATTGGSLSYLFLISSARHKTHCFIHLCVSFRWGVAIHCGPGCTSLYLARFYAMN
jgi:hypothetical protein